MQNLLLNRMINRIRQSLELQEILSVSATEIRSFLQTDRVKIYRFAPDGSGQVIAESVDTNRLPSLLNLHFPAGDIPSHAREMFVKARQRSIVDVPTQRMTISRFDCPPTTGDLTLEDVRSRPIADILQRPVDPCHVDYLTAMGVQSSLVIPILHHENLWGFLVSHHSQPRAFSEESLQIVQMVTDQLSLAIAQSHLLTQTRDRARREGFLNQISTRLHSSGQIEQILQIVLESVVKATQSSGGRLYLTPSDSNSAAQLYTYGIQPSLSGSGQPMRLEDYSFWQELLTDESEEQQGEGKLELSSDFGLGTTDSRRPTLKVIADIYQERQLLTLAPQFRPTPIRSLLVLPLPYGRQALGCLSIFRNEIDTDILWAGRFNPDERNDRVRDSFEAWRELKRGVAREWTPEEIELVWSSSTHLTMALMQNRLYQYERSQRLLVERRNRELDFARSVAEEARRKLEKEIHLRQQVEEALRRLTQREREKAQQLELTLKELQHAQTQLVQNEKMASLGQLVAGVAHEINNPVSFIYGNINPAREYAEDLLYLLQLYQQHYPQPVAEIAEQLEVIEPDFIAEDFPKLLGSMKEGAQRICQIVLSLRNFSRLDEGELKAVDIHEGIDNTLLILEHRLKQQPSRPEIQVIKEYDQLPLVECYPGQLNQVFMNLISNAIDALELVTQSESDTDAIRSGFSPMIRIRTANITDYEPKSNRNAPNESDDAKTDAQRLVTASSVGAAPKELTCVVIRIADNGPGITKEVHSRIFDPFFTTKPPGKGTGLGLSISYRIVVDRHGGKLWCHSAPAQGAEFLIELPISQNLAQAKDSP